MPDTLVVVVSKTPEKVAHFQIAAKGTSVIFIDAHRVTEGYRVAPEDTGDRLGNALQKYNAVTDTIAKLKDPNSTEYQNLQQQCALRKIAFNPDKIFIMVEDSTFTVHEDIWQIFKEKLRSYVPEELLQRNQESGPDAETGPVVAAVGGFLRFYSLLRRSFAEAQGRLGRSKVAIPKINNQCTVALRRLSDPLDQPPIIIEKSSPYQLLEVPDGLEYIKHTPLVNYYDYVALQKSPTVPISANTEDYIARQSPRGLVFQEMLAYFNAQRPESAADQSDALLQEHSHVVEELTRTELQREHNALHATNANLVASTLRHGHIQIPEDHSRQAIYDLIDCDRWIDAHDSLVFYPFDASNPEKRVKAYYLLLSFAVAKQLIARDMFKIGVIEDDGCWSPIITAMAALANKGMAKDFIHLDGLEINDVDIFHGANAYFDWLRYDRHKYNREHFDANIFPDALLQTARTAVEQRLPIFIQDIIQHRSKGYHRFIQARCNSEVETEGVPPSALTERLFTVAHFVSATSDNLTLMRDSAKYGSYLAEIGAGYVWGGMNNHSGGASFHAYKANGGIHAAAFSTPAIVATETEDGYLPTNADYKELAPNIYHRIAGMLANSDVTTIFPGGYGTLQELLAKLYIKNMSPELFANKKIIIYNPTLHMGDEYSGNQFWEKSIKAILNVENRNIDFSSVSHKDVFIARNMHEVQTITDRLCANWNLNYAADVRRNPAQQRWRPAQPDM